MEVIFRATVPQLNGKLLAITGNCSAMGDWQHPVPMQGKGLIRTVIFAEGSLPFPLEYKLVLIDEAQPGLIIWEEGENRRLDSPTDALSFIGGLLICCTPFRGGVPVKLIGTVIPLFSLRTGQSAGVGDFGDLFQLIDWVAETGQHVIQLLPLNDTSTTHIAADSYPYKITSVNALHPIYLSLHRLGALRVPFRAEQYAAESRRLEDLPSLDYVAVIRHKLRYFTDYLTEHPTLLESIDFQSFVSENKEWLYPYAHYRHLTELFGTVDHSFWKEDRFYNSARTEAWCDATPKEFLFTAFLQFTLHKQLLEAAEYARSRGILLKGDLPIGVHRFSVEVWTHPHYFCVEQQAGAPPDSFSHNGQSWGFPLYNWDTMQCDDFIWWKKRFVHLSLFFDALRIDHILGFFRIWAIPDSCTDGRNGTFVPSLPFSVEEICQAGFPFNPVLHADGILFRPDNADPTRFHPLISARDTKSYALLTTREHEAYDQLYIRFFWERHNNLWQETALKRLTPLIADTSMLICAEDLGMLPSTLPIVLQRLQLLSLAVERMPRTLYTDFYPLEEAPYLSVCTPSTHDMAPLRLWWRENVAEATQYYRQILCEDGEPPADCTPELIRRILHRQIHSVSMLTLIAIQDWLALSENLRHPDPTAERINYPDNPHNYWSYRLHIPISDLANLPFDKLIGQ
ncbi:MAG: 4-alpha-glucanotransferase [Tannerellaceae bacterium]|nr:4-alpha-glucanotransferase [Tannerellaceae bacterium]